MIDATDPSIVGRKYPRPPNCAICGSPMVRGSSSRDLLIAYWHCGGGGRCECPGSRRKTRIQVVEIIKENGATDFIFVGD